VLKRLLMPQGMLFAGHSEAGVMTAAGLVSAKIPMAFAFRKAPPQPSAPAAPAPSRASSPRRTAPPAAPRARTNPPRLAGSRPIPAAPSPPPPLQSIEELRRMADCGQLDKASRGVDLYLREYGPSAEALLLLGLISDASGDRAAAERHYRKALYLEPGNNDALGHLALLLKRQGDHAGARLIDDRLRRRDERSPS
jgi:chemotaxis protein methyltransferase WspC